MDAKYTIDVSIRGITPASTRSAGLRAGVQRRIRLKDETWRPPRFCAPEIVDADARGRTERLPVTEPRLHFRMASAGPNSITLQPDEGASVTQLGMKGVWRGKEVVGERVDRRDRKGGCHFRACLCRSADGYFSSPIDTAKAVERVWRPSRHRATGAFRRPRTAAASHPLQQRQLSMKLRRILDRCGCLSLRRALASIWRIRSRDTENCWPTSARV